MLSRAFSIASQLFPFYAALAIILMFAGLGRQTRQSQPDAHTLCFRRTRLFRLAGAAFALLCVWAGFLFVGMNLSHDVHIADPEDAWMAWCFLLPACIGLTVFSLVWAGPSELCVDMEVRVCHTVGGWACFARRLDFRPDDTFTVYVWHGQNSHVVLGGWLGREYRLTLATDSRGAATDIAQDAAGRLGLPFRETTFDGIRQDLRQKRPRR